MIDQLTIAIADDHKLVTQSLSDFLSSSLDCEVSFLASNGQELVDKLLTHNVDIIILDINMPIMDGLEALRIIKSRNAKQKIIVLSMYQDEALLLKLIKLRVNGYLSKSASGEDLLTAIKEVRDKGHHFNEMLVDAMYHKTANIDKHGEETHFFKELDDVDMDILKMICDEMTSKEMSKKLCLSYRTVEGRRKRLIKNLGVKNQVGLVIYAIRQGIVNI